MALLPSQPFARKLIVLAPGDAGASPEAFRRAYEAGPAAELREQVAEGVRAGRIFYRRNYLSALDGLALGAVTAAAAPPPAACVVELGFRLECDFDRFMAGGLVPRWGDVRHVACWDSCVTDSLYTPDEVHLRLFGLMWSLPGLSRTEYIDRYEGRHAKLVGDRFESDVRNGRVLYRRNFVLPDEATPAGAFACLTEFAFADRADHERFQAAFADPGFAQAAAQPDAPYKAPDGAVLYGAHSISR